jgi:hypothetical protein
MRDVDPVKLDLRPAQETRLAYATPLASPPISDLELPAGDRSWAPSAANRPTQVWIAPEGKARIDASLSGLLHGVKNHPSLHNPVTFHLDCPRPTELVVQVSGVSGYGGAHLVARRNEQVVLDKDMPVPPGADQADTLREYDGAYAVAVPAGPQTVVVENVGIDWMNVGYVLRHGRTAAEPALRVLALTGADAAMAWVQNPQHEWYRVLVEKQIPSPVPASLLELPGLAEGRYQVTLWDTYRGVVTRRLSLITQKGSLSIPLPELSKDLAVKAIRVTPTSDVQASRR